jgi:transposase
MTTKLHLCIAATGQWVEGFLTPGNTHDVSVADELTQDIFGCYVLEDRGYDSDPHRSHLSSGRNIPVIPGRSNRNIPVQYDKELYKKRGLIETHFGKLKENRRLSMRYDKSDLNFLAFIAMAAIKINLC